MFGRSPTFRRPVGPPTPRFTTTTPGRYPHTYNASTIDEATRLISSMFGGRVYAIRPRGPHGDTSQGFDVLYRTGTWDAPQERSQSFVPFQSGVSGLGALGDLAAVVTLPSGRARNVKHLCWLLAKKQHTRSPEFILRAGQLTATLSDGTRYVTDVANAAKVLLFLDRSVFAGRPIRVGDDFYLIGSPQYRSAYRAMARAG